ncbi:sugar phosphate isomerase/epimerase family protein [Paenibacillus sp. 1001270B_150601_E10]|uniref:sugar phosphate isomerase/epimerase family protein n=1 Tax=Paenibacillus sp. 1001270B_150601_E10 TaxID=2787079 RepID=UPI00189CF8A4|nr:TIM barrel protein [Paenibacillus sp. 1001270B_150601_E10]
MKVSVGGFSFNNSRVAGHMDIFSYIDTVHSKYGLKTIDLWNAFFADTSRPIWMIADDDVLLRIKQALTEREMTVANLAVDTAHLWNPDPEVRDALHQNALSYLRAAELLGAQSVRIDAVMHGDEDMSDEAFDYIVRRYSEYAAQAADGGYWVGPENHTGFALVPESLRSISESVNHPNYGVLLHLGRWHHAIQPSYSRSKPQPEHVQAALRKSDHMLLPWTKHIHIDWKMLQQEDAVKHICSIIDKGYNQCWAVEYNAPENQIQAVGQALEQLQACLQHKQLQEESSCLPFE